MAVPLIPFSTIYLVTHVGGGKILHAGGGYVAGTLIPASLVTAVTTATSTLANAASSVAALASNPVVLGVAAVAIAATATYCHFYGIPAPVEAVLVKAGLASKAKGGLMITTAKLATAFVVLGAAGLWSFNVYKRLEEARREQHAPITMEEARGFSEGAFGKSLWETYGEAVWLGTADTVAQVTGWAQSAVDATAAMLDRPVAVGEVLGVTAATAAGAGGAAAGAAYATGTVAILGSTTLGGIGVSLGLVSAPVWPVAVGAVGAACLGYAGWKVLRSTLKRSKSGALLPPPK